jgi:hypothetical protein
MVQTQCLAQLLQQPVVEVVEFCLEMKTVEMVARVVEAGFNHLIQV